MTLLGTAVVTDKILRESPRMSVQRSLVPPVLDDDEETGEEKKHDEEKRKTQLRHVRVVFSSSRITCSWDLLRTSKSNHTIGRATFSMPMKSRGYVHVAQHAFEAPFTALIPMQLLGLHIPDRWHTRFCVKRSQHPRLGFRLSDVKMQMSLLEEYKKAASELVGFGNAHFNRIDDAVTVCGVRARSISRFITPLLSSTRIQY